MGFVRKDPVKRCLEIFAPEIAGAAFDEGDGVGLGGAGLKAAAEIGGAAFETVDEPAPEKKR